MDLREQEKQGRGTHHLAKGNETSLSVCASDAAFLTDNATDAFSVLSGV